MSSALSDAVENVLGHAYPDHWPGGWRRVSRWWMLGAADPVKRQVTLAIYDQGITIPASLPKIWGAMDVARVFARDYKVQFSPDATTYDGQTIDAAMKIGATSTQLAHRGLGLNKIREAMLKCVEGQLRIISRCGECVYSADGKVAIKNHTVPLFGTFVELQASFDASEV
ncbi:hypothetical protein [Labrys sp. (in: a-proteobacteria)]|uniref:hypothetical protein n=1 Tax=Labrys sp. (in: a-proteobacteria) TaxID=1917972 RepID=UPI0039E3212A